MQLGNGRWESTTFNSRLQPTQIALGTTPGTTDKLKLEYGYGTTANNGNVLSQTITVPTVGQNTGFVAVQGYNYDSLNRLKDATEMVTPDGGSQVQTWKQTYTFDRYGNRRFDLTGGSTTFPNPSCTEAVCNPTVSASNNRLTSTGWLYDAAGNTTRDGNYQTFTYDAENKQVEVKNSSSVTVGKYWYDGDEKRVKKVVPSTGEVTIFVYDAAGKLVAEYSTVVASAEDAKVAYLTNDHLGSPRINTDRDGAVTSRHDYHPYGEEIVTSQRTSHEEYTPDSVRKQFTGYERDRETGLDFAEARMYSKSSGRFTSADPLLFETKRIADPQQINLYQYVRNNPLNFVDPTGLSVEVTGNEQAAYLSSLQKNLSFTVQINKKTNLVEIVDAKGNVLGKGALKALGKGLKGAEKELFNAITDDKNKATIDTVSRDANVDFGKFNGNGTNTVDRSDLEILDKCTDCGITSAQVVGHETLEAYKAAQLNTSDQTDPHNYANKHFPGLKLPTDGSYFGDPVRKVVTSVSAVLPVKKSKEKIEVFRDLVTPIPYRVTPKGIVPMRPTPGPQPAHITQVKKVTK